jgi:hypothetical protein
MEIKKIRFTDDGSQFLVSDEPRVIVEIMRGTSRFASEETLETYMAGFSDRYRVQSGNSVRCDTADNFVTDLFGFGFLEEVSSE